MLSSSSYAAHKHQVGSSFIEILITILIVTIGMMGLGAMQLRAMGNNQWQLQQSTATLLSYQMFERMRANRSAAVGGAYQRTLPASGNDCATVSTGNILAGNDLNAWFAEMQAHLGDGACGSIDCALDGICEIEIVWTDDLADTVGLQTRVKSDGAI